MAPLSLPADLLHALLPSDCRICTGPLLGLRTVRVCEVCLASVRTLAPVPEQLCLRCGDALGMESARFAAALGIRECTGCRIHPPAFTRAVSFAPYDGALRELLHLLKYGGVHRLSGSVLGAWMAETILLLQAELAAGALVVPVPLFRRRQRARGYNQAELLARSALKHLKRTYPKWSLELATDVLCRVRDTRAMYELRPDQRRRNLVGAFAVQTPERVQGRNVLLLDDILTTGATANHCAKVLLKAGAAAVWVATVARAQPEHLASLPDEVAFWDKGAENRAGAPAFRSDPVRQALDQFTGGV